jgi:uncharacterized membrane protein YdjX (TVP38/TMEM64 family)
VSDPNPQRVPLMRVVLLISLLALLGWVYFSGVASGVNFQQFKAQLGYWQEQVEQNLLLAIISFFAVYVLVTGLSLPIAVWLSLLAGALFGRWVGTAIVSLAATLGATLAMLASRYLLRDWLLHCLKNRFEPLQNRFVQDGPYLLLSLRLVPIFPFWMINLGMGLTPISTRQYTWLSWLGMLPGTFLYVSLGTDFASIESPQGLITLAVLRWLVLLAVFPWLVRMAWAWFKRPPRQ